MNYKIKAYILLGISFVALVCLLFAGYLPQDPNYHFFADERSLFNVPNFWNVVTNLPFCIIGVLGVLAVRTGRTIKLDQESRPECAVRELDLSCYVFFIGILFTGIGSAYYHWNPMNSTLVWDRLPMTIAFMGFFSFLVGTYISAKAGKQILWPLVGIGIMSIVYWKFSGDLRLYALVQFLPALLAPLILLFYKKPGISAKYHWMMIVFYALAKVFEYYDKQIFLAMELSGHSIKHLFSGLVPLSLLMGLRKISAVKGSP